MMITIAPTTAFATRELASALKDGLEKTVHYLPVGPALLVQPMEFVNNLNAPAKLAGRAPSAMRSNAQADARGMVVV